MHPEMGAFFEVSNGILYKYSLSYSAFVSIIQYKKNKL